MAQYVTGLIRSGKLPEEDLLRFEANLEDSNFPAEEMVQVLAELAASPADDRPAVTCGASTPAPAGIATRSTCLTSTSPRKADEKPRRSIAVRASWRPG